MSTNPSTLVAMIRQRPGMYVGSSGSGGVEHMIHELVANGLDLFLSNQARRIEVSSEGDAICVRDDGPGLPFEKGVRDTWEAVEKFFTQMHETPTADGHSPHVHLNPAGLGLAVVCALSSKMQVVSYRAGYRWEQHFECGNPLTPPKISKTRGRGTSITFTPDRRVLSAISPCWSAVRRKLFDTAHLFPGITLGVHAEIFHAPGGLASYAEFIGIDMSGGLGRPPHKTFSIQAEFDGVKVIAAAYGTAQRCIWRSWCNGTSTALHGSHVDGFKDALRRCGWKPATAMIHVLMTRPQFNAPTRSQLAVHQVRAIVCRLMSEGLAEFNLDA